MAPTVECFFYSDSPGMGMSLLMNDAAEVRRPASGACGYFAWPFGSASGLAADTMIESEARR
jgi:hypothetical protein